jgi:hypothetical protein
VDDDLGMGDVARAIHVEVLNATIGLEAGYRLAIEADDVIAAALEHMPDAEDIWFAWQEGNGNS